MTSIPTRRDRAIAAAWNTMERQRYPDHPKLRVPVPDLIGPVHVWNSKAFARAVEIADAVLAAVE